jgi:uncharacterized protein (UPF0276 family)
VTHSSRLARLATRIRTGLISAVRLILQQTENRGPTRSEWDDDVPPFPILIGEVARAEATLTVGARRRSRRLAH